MAPFGLAELGTSGDAEYSSFAKRFTGRVIIDADTLRQLAKSVPQATTNSTEE